MKKKVVFIISCVIIFLSTIVAESCSEKVSKEDLFAARDNGRKRALEFSPSFHLDTFKMEAMLIDIREREKRLRDMGHEKIADEYISTFISTLDSVNPALASQLHN